MHYPMHREGLCQKFSMVSPESEPSADRDFYIFPFLLMPLFISAGAIYIPRHVRRTPELCGGY